MGESNQKREKTNESDETSDETLKTDSQNRRPSGAQ